MNDRIAVVIVTFGRRKLLELTLSSLFATYDRTRCSVTVVDNNSGRDVLNLLAKYHSKIDNLVWLNENRGKPYAWNVGAKIAREECLKLKRKAPAYMLFCDSDLSFKNGWHDALVESYEDHKNLPLCCLSAKSWPPHKENAVEHVGPRRTVYEYRFPPGCCILMSTKVYDANGCWDTRRLIRTVDTSYYRNVLTRGYKNASVKDTVIEHTGKKERTWNNATGEPKYRR